MVIAKYAVGVFSANSFAPTICSIYYYICERIRKEDIEGREKVVG
jgi:hypothetical protein